MLANMKGLDNSAYFTLYIISNAVALIMLLAAWKAPRISRLMFFLLFAWASYTNWTEAIRSPQVYLGYADLAFLDLYKQFILGWFSKHITAAVGFIATCQALIAVAMFWKGLIFKIGVVCAIIFLLAIAPLGVGSAFPCTVIVALTLYVILKKPKHDFLWNQLTRTMLKDEFHHN
jgi:hypothetical protein